MYIWLPCYWKDETQNSLSLFSQSQLKVANKFYLSYKNYQTWILFKSTSGNPRSKHDWNIDASWSKGNGFKPYQQSASVSKTFLFPNLFTLPKCKWGAVTDVMEDVTLTARATELPTAQVMVKMGIHHNLVKSLFQCVFDLHYLWIGVKYQLYRAITVFYTAPFIEIGCIEIPHRVCSSSQYREIKLCYTCSINHLRCISRFPVLEIMELEILFPHSPSPSFKWLIYFIQLIKTTKLE